MCVCKYRARARLNTPCHCLCSRVIVAPVQQSMQVYLDKCLNKGRVEKLQVARCPNCNSASRQYECSSVTRDSPKLRLL